MGLKMLKKLCGVVAEQPVDSVHWIRGLLFIVEDGVQIKMAVCLGKYHASDCAGNWSSNN